MAELRARIESLECDKAYLQAKLDEKWTTKVRPYGGVSWQPRGQPRKVHLVYLPVQAPWLNRVERFFGDLQRELLNNSRFGGVRELVRAVLYMSVVAAVRCNEVIQAFYQHLRAAGKPVKVALVACMRKLLTILNAILKQRSPWRSRLSAT